MKINLYVHVVTLSTLVKIMTEVCTDKMDKEIDTHIVTNILWSDSHKRRKTCHFNNIDKPGKDYAL